MKQDAIYFSFHTLNTTQKLELLSENLGMSWTVYASVYTNEHSKVIEF
jgi:hypothetical protein